MRVWPPVVMVASLYFFFNAASNAGAALAALSGSPSWKVTLERSENLQRLKSGSCCHAVASCGSMMARAFTRTKVSDIAADTCPWGLAGSSDPVESSTVNVPPKRGRVAPGRDAAQTLLRASHAQARSLIG